MKIDSSTLVEIWRAAGSHVRLEEAVGAIAQIVAGRLPLGALAVRRWDMGRSAVETAAMVRIHPDAMPELGRIQTTSDEMTRLAAGCERGRLWRAGKNAAAHDAIRAILPTHGSDDWIAGPLHSHDKPSGILIVVARPGSRFDDSAEGTVEALLEPISAALETDGRLREMAALREAAEAEKTSLLSRLGRQKLGDTIVGEDSGLKVVMERVQLVARSDVPVLIFGETGTGKELVARAIHTRSARAAGPFMRVNCGAIPPELIDSQLFGHERGSFTGATASHRGWFERADGGTLFLDEIGELPLAAQVRLLRVLQDGAFERVGGQQPTAVDVRIVAATHRDLAGMVQDGRFREDLWYRLAVFPMVLPPLRERQADIPPLARHFAKRAAIRFGLPPQLPTPDDLRLLCDYPWPGNVRELAAVLDRAAILGDGRRLEVAKALGVAAAPTSQAAAPPAIVENGPASIVSLDRAMREHIEKALAATGGRIDGPFGAAAKLEIHPQTLRARMRKLGVDWKAFRK